MDSRSPEFTALRIHNTPHATLRPQRFCFEGVRTPTHRSKSLTSREIGFDSGFWFLGGLRLGSPQRHALPPQAQRHVNQKSFDLTTPNDISVRRSRLVLRVSFARRANEDRARCAASNCD